MCADLDVDGAKETVRLIEAGGRHRRAVRRRRVRRRTRWRRPSPSVVEHFGRLDIVFNNVGIPTPRLGDGLRGAHRRRLRAALRGQRRRRLPRLQARRHPFKAQGGGGVILNTGSVAGLVGWGGTVYGATKGAVHQLTRAVADRGGAVRDPGQRRSARRACPTPGSWPPAALEVPDDVLEQIAESVGREPPARPADHRRGLRRGGRVPRARTGPPTSPACSCPVDGGTSPDDRRQQPLDARPGADPRAVRPPRQRQRLHRRRLHRRPEPARGTAPRAGPGPPGHRARAARASRATLFFHGLPRARSRRTSRRSASPPATPPTATTTVFASSPPTIDGRGRRSADRAACSHGRRAAPPLPGARPAVVHAGQGPVVDRPSGSRRPSTRLIDCLRRRRAGRAQRRLLRRHPGAHDHRQLRHRRRPGPRHPGRRCTTRTRWPTPSRPIVAARRDDPRGRPDQRAGARPSSPTRTA